MSGRTSAPVLCGAKHTKPQIPDDAWKCPKCGAKADSEKPFVIEDGPEDHAEDCALLHEEDYAFCENCGYGANGKTLARQYARAASLVSCPHCKGTGMVKAEGR